MSNNSQRSMSRYAVCDSCGEILPPTATFCPNCGSRRISGGVSRETELPYQYGLDDDDEMLRVSIPRRLYQDSVPQEADRVKFQRDYEEYEPSEELYPDEQWEEDAAEPYLNVPMIGMLAAVAFLAVVLLVAFTGLLSSFFYREDISAPSEQDIAGGSSAVSSDASSVTSDEKAVVHLLPEDVKNEKYVKYSLENNKFSTAMASSYISEKLTHGSTDRAFDGDPETSWQDGVKGYGKGEWLLAYNSDGSAVKVSSVTVYNGYLNPQFNTEKKDMYLVNSRVSDFTLEFDDGSTESFTLLDEKEAQTFHFKERKTCYVRFTVGDVYKGTKYKDTCIGEIIYK